MVRIAFVGAQGTGKTTLMMALKDRLSKDGYRVEHIDEPARKCPFPIDTGATFEAEFWMMTTQINEENLKARNQPDVLLADRCVLDQYVYWTFVIENLKKAADQASHPGERDMQLARIRQEHAILEAIFKNWITRIQRIVMVEVSETQWSSRGLHDGVRNTDVSWFKLLRERFLEVAKREGIALTTLQNDGSFEDTVERAVELIRTHLPTRA